MADRISRRAEDLLFQLSSAATAITAFGVNWPAGAPTVNQVAGL